MIRIKAEKLTPEAFAPFGTYTNVMNPEGYHIGGEFHDFYRDQAKFYSDSLLPVGLSPLTVRNHGYVVEGVEWHNHTCEGMMPVNDDAVMHVSLASGDYDVSQTRAFIIPKGTIITIFPAVYHLTPLPVHEKELHALIMLPERCYVNDFFYKDLVEDSRFEIEL